MNFGQEGRGAALVWWGMSHAVAIIFDIASTVSLPRLSGRVFSDYFEVISRRLVLIRAIFMRHIL